MLQTSKTSHYTSRHRRVKRFGFAKSCNSDGLGDKWQDVFPDAVAFVADKQKARRLKMGFLNGCSVEQTAVNGNLVVLRKQCF